MVKRRSASRRAFGPSLLVALGVAAIGLFLAGELVAWGASDHGRLAIWRYLGLGDRARAVRIVGKRIEQGLARAGVPPSAIASQAEAGKGPALAWTVTLPPGGSPLLVNEMVTREVESGGGAVLAGRERVREDGAQVVSLLVGVPGRATHALEIVRPGRPAPGEDRPAKVAVLLVAGAGEDSLLVAACRRPQPFAVGAIASGSAHDPVLRAAHESRREVVLFVPMEPENYPRVNPGPATLLVNMPPGRIEQSLRHDIEAAAPVVAVANLMGSFATQDEPFMTAVYHELRRANLPFLHVAGVPRSVCRPLAGRVGAVYDEPDATLDGEARRADAKALDRAWAAALERARKRGSALVVLRLTPASAAWLDRALVPARLDGIELAPVSAVIRRPAEPD